MTVLRELKKEIGLIEIQLEYWVNDPKYDCDIYIVDIKEAILERMEFEKISL